MLTAPCISKTVVGGIALAVMAVACGDVKTAPFGTTGIVVYGTATSVTGAVVPNAEVKAQLFASCGTTSAALEASSISTDRTGSYRAELRSIFLGEACVRLSATSGGMVAIREFSTSLRTEPFDSVRADLVLH